MSESEVQRFLQTISEQPELEARLRAEGADPSAVAAEAGFAFDADTLNALLTEVSDAELDGVAGGLGVAPAPIPRPGGPAPAPPPIDLGGDDDPFNWPGGG